MFVRELTGEPPVNSRGAKPGLALEVVTGPASEEELLGDRTLLERHDPGHAWRHPSGS